MMDKIKYKYLFSMLISAILKYKLKMKNVIKIHFKMFFYLKVESWLRRTYLNIYYDYLFFVSKTV